MHNVPKRIFSAVQFDTRVHWPSKSSKQLQEERVSKHDCEAAYKASEFL